MNDTHAESLNYTEDNKQEEIKRIIPPKRIEKQPSFIAAIMCALKKDFLPEQPVISDDGTISAEEADRYIRKIFPVQKRQDYEQDEHMTLRQLTPDHKAIVLLHTGQYVFVWQDVYWSFSTNLDDSVVSAWFFE